MTAVWTIEQYCQSHFLRKLNLTSTHPFCSEAAPQPYDLPDVPPQGPLQHFDHLETLADVAQVLFFAHVAPVLAFAQLWARLLAAAVAPFGTALLLLYDRLVDPPPPREAHLKRAARPRGISPLCLSTVASSTIIFVDALYRQEYGAKYVSYLLILSSALALRTAHRHRLPVVTAITVALLVVAAWLDYDAREGTFLMGAPREACSVAEGLYYDRSSSRAASIVGHWPEAYRRYSFEAGATPWMPSGDARTGLPYFLNYVPQPPYTRVWLPVDGGDEAVALDVMFPPATGHDTTRPLYLVLHGLSGGSLEDYVEDFVWRRTAEGSTVAVMVARGLMDLPVRGWRGFHGARWTDAHEAAVALRRAMEDGQMLAGVGYSMGGVILGNYVVRSGAQCQLDAAGSPCWCKLCARCCWWASGGSGTAASWGRTGSRRCSRRAT
jgi:hypothetical protein